MIAVTAKIVNRAAGLVIVLLGLSACSYLGGEDGMFRDRGGDYRVAQVTPTMRIPNELDSYTIDELYVIPERITSESIAFEDVPMPRPIETRRREGVIIQSLSERRWILIDATPGQVWPRIRDYWTEIQIALDYENPSAGILETAWVEIGSDEDMRHKYRITIEPGLHSGYSEIYVLHLQNERTEPIPTIVAWPAESNSDDLELEMLRSVSQFLADRNDIYQASAASLLAGNIQAESKANIVEGAEGESVLELKVDYNRAWVQVRQALNTAEIDIVDENRDQSFFNVKFAGIVRDDDSPGFLGRILGRTSDSDLAAQDFSIRVIESDQVINVVTEALDGTVEENQLTLELLQVINDNLT